MRILLVFSLLAAACGGAKKAPQTPPAATEPTGDKDEEMQDKDKPDDPDDMPKDGADPCDGGE